MYLNGNPSVGYVTDYDATVPSAPNAWHAGYFVAKSLERASLALEYIGPLREPFPLALKGRQLLLQGLLRQRYPRQRTRLVLDSYARQVQAALRQRDVDVVFSPGSVPIAHLDCEQPIVIWTDATFARLVDFYESLSNLSSRSLSEGHAAEKAALDRCSIAIYTSQWAADSAVNDYGVPREKVRVVPFGANLDLTPTEAEFSDILAQKSQDKCRLLFIGVDWIRKGGDIAIEVASELNRRGIETELAIVGCEPSIKPNALPSYVRMLGYLPKTSGEGLSTLSYEFGQAHFLLLPTLADCTPTVINEANAFGVPCLATDVGGIATQIEDDVNGKTFSTNANASAYCDYVEEVVCDLQRYRNLCRSSYRRYRTVLNWDVSGRKVAELLRQLA
jgi:glycosyltransferase involved in cell wall biosynthesis